MKKIKVLSIYLVTFILFAISINAIQDSNLSNNNVVITADVVTTNELDKILYIPIDGLIENYDAQTREAHDFLERVYPIRDDSIPAIITTDIHISNIGVLLTDEEQCNFLKSFWEAHVIRGTFDYRVVGVVPNGWFNDHGYGDIAGLTCQVPWVALVDARPRHVIAHEIGHTYGLCDEYSTSSWHEQDTNDDTTIDLCPNGDEDDNDQLDSNCFSGITGCPVDIDTILDSYLGNAEIKNIMGSGDLDNLRWISKTSYSYLLDKTIVNSNLQNVAKAVLVSGTIYKNGSIVFDPIYSLENMTLINRTNEGNYSIMVVGSSNYSKNFTTDYSMTKIGGNTTELNQSNFAFLLPADNNSNSVKLIKNGNVIKEFNVSLHSPSININSIDNSEPHSERFNISWNATDADNNQLYYAILISANNGTNFTTLIHDYTNTSYEFNPSNFPTGNGYLFKILVTDGFNTKYNLSNTFSINTISVSLGIDSIERLYSNSTLNTFEIIIRNNGTSSVNDVFWNFNAGDGRDVNSSSNLTQLSANEIAFVYIQYNYSDENSYNVIFNATGLRESDIINTFLQTNIEVGSLLIINLENANSSSTNVIFEAQVKNILNEDINNINWSLLTGEGQTIDSIQNVSLRPNETIFLYINHNYNSGGTFNPELLTRNPSYSDSRTISIDLRHLESLTLAVLNETESRRVFENVIKNFLNTNLTNVTWTFDTKNSNVINSTSNVILTPSEQIFVYVDYNFTTSGTFNVNATSRNGTLIDSINLSTTV